MVRCMSLKQIFDWFRWFKNSRQLVDDDERLKRPSTSNTPETSRTHDVWSEIGIGYGT